MRLAALDFSDNLLTIDQFKDFVKSAVQAKILEAKNKEYKRELDDLRKRILPADLDFSIPPIAAFFITKLVEGRVLATKSIEAPRLADSSLAVAREVSFSSEVMSDVRRKLGNSFALLPSGEALGNNFSAPDPIISGASDDRNSNVLLPSMPTQPPEDFCAPL